ncbi:uncharacterized protein LOC142775837 isoform X4 [Rhipicephalus microplus]|uniref:uncharacterized protein LOC142775837 isoform X4 n=1 Tax=Rhipicephalus microplus TaxID=6941 RepID=UPI003F6C46EF
MWRGSMHGSLIWMDCNLLGSFEGTKLPNGWLQGCSISIRQDTGINNNVLDNKAAPESITKHAAFNGKKNYAAENIV